MYPSWRLAASFALVLLSLSETFLFSTADFNSHFNIAWRDGRAKILDDGQELQLMIGRYSGLFKLIPENSSGTITTFYLNSPLKNHDEVDLEFLGNTSEDMYILHTNLFASRNGSREQQFQFWFDPTSEFHNCTNLWYMDGTPIRVLKKANTSLAGYTDIQPMKIQASISDGSDWSNQLIGTKLHLSCITESTVLKPVYRLEITQVHLVAMMPLCG
uniref:GH16 domain-containing protein n=1 Tax=Ananas comosus var. bracteatus TaxID=296719 RepID=A0A6V7P081_ANACO|nr:unnamed protein product [Ananas comosus var. bracteatus]